MTTHHYRVRGKQFEDVPEFSPEREDDVDIFWTHVVAPDKGELERALEDIGAPESIVEMIVDAEPHPEVHVSDGVVGCTFPIQVPEDWSRTYLSFVIREHHVLSYTSKEVSYIEKFRRDAATKGTEIEVGQLGALLEQCGKADRDALRAMRHAVDTLTLRVETVPEEVSLPDIRKLKHAILTCGNICEDQAFCLTAFLSPVAQAAVGRGAATRDALVELVRYLDRSFDRLDVRARELEGHLHFAYQKKTEDRLRILTVLSAVFMPLTLIAGIYGMNFAKMPELGYEDAYFVCLGAMAAIALVMMVYFYRTGWLKPSE